MKACLLRKPALVETNSLDFCDTPKPEPDEGAVVVHIRACGVCRTDLHVVEGELTPRLSPVIPGHQIVGVIEIAGARVTRLRVGDRVGVAWLRRTCGVCEYCRAGKENLCENAVFTGYTAPGRYAEYVAAPEAFVYKIPNEFLDVQATPLLCAGIIGYRALRLSGIQPGGRLGFYGFGPATRSMRRLRSSIAPSFSRPRARLCRPP